MAVTDDDVRSRPTADWIASIRQRYRVEPTIDIVLTRKLDRRATATYFPPVIDDIAMRLSNFLRDRIGGDLEISDLQPLTGGASQEQFVFQLAGPAAERHGIAGKHVLRREPNEATVATHRMREFQLLKAMEGVAPVPPVSFVDPDGDYFERPALICGFVSGVQKPSAGSGNVSGIGIQFSSGLRARLGPEFVRHIAAIHLADPREKDLSALVVPPTGSPEGNLMLIDWFSRVWDEDKLEDIPLMSVTRNWLIRHAPPIDRVSVVHGDYRSGNFLFDEASGKITAILDWELGYLGDRHADLAYIVSEAFGSRGPDGELLCSGLMPPEEFIALYERESGLSVDPWRIRYFTILNLWRSIALATGAGARAALGNKSHQDVVVTWLASIGYPMLETVRNLLEKELNGDA